MRPTYNYLRRLLNAEFLRRLDPTYQPEIEVTSLAPSYGEDAEFQRESAGEDPRRDDEHDRWESAPSRMGR